MAEETTSAQAAGGTDTEAQAASSTSTLTVEQMQKEIESLRKESAKWRTKLRAEEESKAKAAEDEAKKRGEFEQLYTKRDAEAKALEARVSAIEAAQEAEFGELIKDFADDEQELIDASLPIERRLTLARKLAAKLKGKDAPGMGAGGGRDTKLKFGGFNSENEWAAKDPAGYKKAKGLRNI